KLNNKLKDIPRNKKIFFIGKTNTGKSSLINKLLEINKKQPTLSTSPFMNTTLDLKKIKLDKLEIIDTPGFIDKTNILNFVDAKFSKSILTVNGVNSKNYYLSSNQSILIEKLAIFNYLVGDKNNFTFYLSKNLNLLRCKYEKALSNFNNENISAISYNSTMKLDLITHKFTLNKNKKYNLYINGLVMISINAGAEEISVTLDKNIGVILSETAII
ncbi:MAG: 50S ribosome-binding GTPase, partial [Ureaplasma sp.]|nr:50S ribosome-binding GTPase [Ureaplasma sp.]